MTTSTPSTRRVNTLPTFVTHLPMWNPSRAGTQSVGDETGCHQANQRHVNHSVEPEIPGDEKADLIAESKPGPFVESAFERHQAVQIGHNEGERKEKQNDGERP